jgi:hypothetical protein
MGVINLALKLPFDFMGDILILMAKGNETDLVKR